MTTPSGYNAFISYSHQQDRVLGPALQTSLERFAKPWYRTRALRIFRNTANLAANPALWTSIEDALRSSQWFILLASADAAQSVWVNREVQWWLAHRSPDQLLVVGTSPGLAWDEQKRDWADDAPVPPALRGAFTGKPLWVDLSGLQLDSHKTLIPDDLAAAVAAPIQGAPKDLLVSKHLRQHRRTLQVAGAAVVAVLTALAVVVGFLTVGQRSTPLRQQNQAIFNRIVAEAQQLQGTNQSLAAQLFLVAHKMRPTAADITSQLLDTTGTALANPLTGPGGAVGSVVFSPDGHTLAAGSADDKIWLWNIANPQSPIRIGHPVTGPGGAVGSVAFSPDGHTLAAGSADDKIWLWNIANPQSPIPIGHPLTGPAGAVLSVAFSPDGHTLAAGSADNNVWLWNIARPGQSASIGQPLTGPGNAVSQVAFSPDGRTLAAGSADDEIWLWNIANPQSPARIGRLTGPGGYVESVAFSPDGRTLAAGSDDRKIWLWNIANPQSPIPIGHPLTGPGGAVGQVAFSPDGRTLAAGSADDKVWLWNIARPGHPARIGRPVTGPGRAVWSVAFSPDGRTLAAGGADRMVWAWNLDVTQVITRVCATTSGDLTRRQWIRNIPQLRYEPPCHKT